MPCSTATRRQARPFTPVFPLCAVKHDKTECFPALRRKTPSSFPQRAVPRPWRPATPDALPSPLLRRLSRLRAAAAGGGSGGAKMPDPLVDVFLTTYMDASLQLVQGLGTTCLDVRRIGLL